MHMYTWSNLESPIHLLEFCWRWEETGGPDVDMQNSTKTVTQAQNQIGEPGSVTLKHNLLWIHATSAIPINKGSKQSYLKGMSF